MLHAPPSARSSGWSRAICRRTASPASRRRNRRWRRRAAAGAASARGESEGDEQREAACHGACTSLWGVRARDGRLRPPARTSGQSSGTPGGTPLTRTRRQETLRLLLSGRLAASCPSCRPDTSARHRSTHASRSVRVRIAGPPLGRCSRSCVLAPSPFARAVALGLVRGALAVVLAAVTARPRRRRPAVRRPHRRGPLQRHGGNVDALEQRLDRRIGIVNWYQNWGGGDWISQRPPERRRRRHRLRPHPAADLGAVGPGRRRRAARYRLDAHRQRRIRRLRRALGARPARPGHAASTCARCTR